MMYVAMWLGMCGKAGLRLVARVQRKKCRREEAKRVMRRATGGDGCMSGKFYDGGRLVGVITPDELRAVCVEMSLGDAHAAIKKEMRADD